MSRLDSIRTQTLPRFGERNAAQAGMGLRSGSVEIVTCTDPSLLSNEGYPCVRQSENGALRAECCAMIVTGIPHPLPILRGTGENGALRA